MIAFFINHSILAGMASPDLSERGLLKTDFVNGKNLVMQDRFRRQSFASLRVTDLVEPAQKTYMLPLVKLFRNVVRGFSLVLHDPEGSHYKI